jgi:hypothetical protein
VSGGGKWQRLSGGDKIKNQEINLKERERRVVMT